ncbi:hypothetical protein Tcan_05965 [Toxocara canis]|uniref:Uncharacterized protein n=1 Tax=Toxocara canis TaxID=6265 RepID=A0A0B2VJ18_TOXCA|nr:hypothetical protein Tcan_05965 [Toxocara canis]
MRSVILFALAINLVIVLQAVPKKEKLVRVVVKKALRDKLKRIVKCSPIVRLNVNDKTKTLNVHLRTSRNSSRISSRSSSSNSSRKSSHESTTSCFSILHKYANGLKVVFPYGHQISHEVILQYCDLIQLSGSSKSKDGKRKHYMITKLRCQEKPRPPHHCFIEYIFVMIFACATLGTFITVFVQCCRGSRKQNREVYVGAAAVTSGPQPVGAASGTTSSQPAGAAGGTSSPQPAGAAGGTSSPQPAGSAAGKASPQPPSSSAATDSPQPDQSPKPSAPSAKAKG